jgi:glutamyl-tRNA reductase
VRGAARATLSRHRGRLLRDLFEGAAEEACRAASSNPSSRSIAAVAATRALELVGRPFPRVLVVGSGAVGRQVTELLAPSSRVTITYRHQPPDEEFLRSTGARAVRATGLAAEVELSDAVVTAAKTGDRCLGVRELAAARAVVVIDLGMPRNVDPAVRQLPGVRLVDLAELGARPGPEADDRLGPRLDMAADRLYARLDPGTLEPWVAAVRREAEGIRRAELDVGRRFLGELTPDQELAVDRLTRRLVNRLLHEPTRRVRSLPSGPDGDRLRRFALELWRTDATGS